MEALAQLSSLTHLTELQIRDFILDLVATTAEVSPIQPLPSVRVLRLDDFRFVQRDADPPVGATFCGIFSTLYPSLSELHLRYERSGITRKDFYVDEAGKRVARPLTDIKSHLFRFGNLCKYEMA